MRRVLLGIVSVAAFCGILVAAFWGGGPAEKKPAAGPVSPAVEAPKKADEPAKAPPKLLGVEAVPGPEDEWRGARVGVEGRKEIEAALAEYAASKAVAGLTGPARAAALARREMELLWGTNKAVESLAFAAPWMVAVEEAPGSGTSSTAVDIAAALRDFNVAFRARFRTLFESRPPAADWIAPVVVLPSRDEYLRRAKPPAFAVSHTNLQSGWAFLSPGNRDLVESALYEATWQSWIALARARASIPVSSLETWFWYGTAGYFSSFTRDDQGRLHPGDGPLRSLPDIRAAVRDKTLKPLSALLTPTFADLDRMEDPRAAFAVMAQSGAFVAFLEKSEEGKRRALLDRYAELELSGKGGLEAARDCFGDLDSLDREYVEFVKKLR